MSDPMKIRANVVGDSTEVKVLMSHEMETGQRKDAQGKVIPAWHSTNVTATYNGKTVLAAQWGPAVAKNPFLSFKFKGGAKGEKVVITWVDNKGDKRVDEAVFLWIHGEVAHREVRHPAAILSPTESTAGAHRLEMRRPAPPPP